MLGERIFTGQVASPGMARGAIELRWLKSARKIAAGSPDEEKRALDSALAAARARLAELAAAGDEIAREILMFQIALLEDPELTTAAHAGIAEGAAAAEAWAAALDAQIAGYERADDYFRARAADLIDVRDRVHELLTDSEQDTSAPATGERIFVSKDLVPSRFLETDWSHYRGAALVNGSAASHVAILARARGVPLLIGLGADKADLTAGATAVLDAEAGRLILDPADATVERYRRRAAVLEAEAMETAACLSKPAVTANGQSIRVSINVDDPAVLGEVDPGHCDGIGLARTEFLFQGAGGFPDEDKQYAVYARLVDWAAGAPVIVRTLDAGGDKPIPGLTVEAEANPFLGVRGLRLSLLRPEVFHVQLRALARAAATGPLKVMVPMVTTPDELARARGMLQAAVEELEREGTPAKMPPLGMMVEVPAAALNVAAFEADFYSIGSNDLIQYVMATSRGATGAAHLYDALNPAVLELIARVAEHGAVSGREVSLCGDMAADPDCLPHLIEAGLQVLSVAPAALARTKYALGRCRGVGDNGG